MDFLRASPCSVRRSRCALDEQGVHKDKRLRGQEREFVGAEDGQPALRCHRIPSKEEMAARGLEDLVFSLSLGDNSSWALLDNQRCREHAFTYAGGRAAEVRQSKLRAAEVKRALLRGFTTDDSAAAAKLSDFP